MNARCTRQQTPGSETPAGWAPAPGSRRDRTVLVPGTSASAPGAGCRVGGRVPVPGKASNAGARAPSKSPTADAIGNSELLCPTSCKR